MALPTDVNDSPNYDPDDHADHHNLIHVWFNTNGDGSTVGFEETSPGVWVWTQPGSTTVELYSDADIYMEAGTTLTLDDSGGAAIVLDDIRALIAGTVVTANRQTGNYVLVLTDANKVIEMNVAGANTLTVPPNSSVPFPIGTVIEGVQWGAGQTTITPGVGVTIRSSGGKLKTAAQYASFSLRKVAADEWHVTGELSA